MSRTYSAIKNKHQKQAKVHYQSYLYNASEPLEDIFTNATAELESELLQNSSEARQEFRHLAHRMRTRYV